MPQLNGLLHFCEFSIGALRNVVLRPVISLKSFDLGFEESMSLIFEMKESKSIWVLWSTEFLPRIRRRDDDEVELLSEGQTLLLFDD
jgi:hypothetical protein